MEKVSIIVPVYNVEKYIRTCIESILNQDYQNFELILVDDGTPDASGKICDEYMEKDNRIQVIHKKNGGLSDARNIGIRKATGKYMMFVDSDDHIESNTLSSIVPLAEKVQADVIVFGYYADVVDAKGKVRSHQNFGPDRILEDIKEITETAVQLKKNFVFDSCCNKIYLAETIKKNNIFMPVGEIFEDTAFNLDIIPYLKKMVISSNCYYHYMQRNFKGITSIYQPEKKKIQTKRHLKLMEHLLKYHEKESMCIKHANYIYLKYIFSCMTDLFFPCIKLDFKQRCQEIKKLRDDMYVKEALLNIKGFSSSDRLIIWLFQRRFLLWLYCSSKIVYLLKNKYKKIFFILKQK